MTDKNPIMIHLPRDSREAVKYIVETLLKNVYPLLHRISKKLHLQSTEEILDECVLSRLRDMHTLCSSQVKKCVVALIDILKLEHSQQLYLQESRQCVIERLSCCIEKLHTIEERLEDAENINQNDSDDSLLVTTMYFVNWIDQTFEILNKFSSVIYKTDYKKSDKMYEEWKTDIVEYVSGLHTSIDELLLAAMTLCRYCLSSDQPIVKARCQVVLRETKALLGDLIVGDLESVFHAAKESLKLPIMPSNINLLIDVLKDVLYVLETNTNTALLALLVHCFSFSLSPVEILRNHLKCKKNDKCPCDVEFEDVAESCLFVKEFDLYNERLLQIGSFAVSCSSDQKRIMVLRSSLASLEALDPHLVPALMLSPDSSHSALLINSWNQEVVDIRNNVFLIVDPVAFSNKVKQMMHQILLDITKENTYNNSKVCSLINMGCTVHEFFNIYNEYEPEALVQHTDLLPLLHDLNKVQIECKVVSNMLCTEDDSMYDVKKCKPFKAISFEQLLKRLKLLYTLITRISTLVSPKDNDQQFFEEEPQIEIKNVTHTVYVKNDNTYVHSPRKPINTISRSFFARTTNIRSSTAKFPLPTPTKNLKVKQLTELSFSLKLDDLCDASLNKAHLNRLEKSVLYHSPMKNRSSLRKAVLSRQCTVHKGQMSTDIKESDFENSVLSEKGSLMDATTSLQITDVLNQINDLTNISTTRLRNINATISLSKQKHCEAEEIRNNVLKLDINSAGTAKFKHVWNISVNSSGRNIGDTSQALDVTQSSNVTTLERINDLEYVENKLNQLKSVQMETSL